jgi:hypothetical protein
MITVSRSLLAHSNRSPRRFFRGKGYGNLNNKLWKMKAIKTKYPVWPTTDLYVRGEGTRPLEGVDVFNIYTKTGQENVGKVVFFSAIFIYFFHDALDTRKSGHDHMAMPTNAVDCTRKLGSGNATDITGLPNLQ